MAYRFFGFNIEKSCDSCDYGKLGTLAHLILCNKKGITNASYVCRHYKYNPLRRIPKAHDENDFSKQFGYKKEDFIL